MTNVPIVVPFHSIAFDRLAVGNLVNGVSTATYKRFSTKAAAEESYRQALQNGEVHILQHGVSYLV